MKDKLLILDMDNTILHSKIDFRLMQEDVARILNENGFGKYINCSVAKSIFDFKQSADYDEMLAEKIWKRVTELEKIGLDQAQLEPQVTEALVCLNQFAELAILSNNTDEAIRDNLDRLGIMPYLSFIAGRNTVPSLKPSPAGLLLIKEHYPHISLSNTFAIGDAWIDAQAAQAANIGFISYNHSRQENWEAWNIQPLLQLSQWNKDACDRIRGLWK